MCRGKGLPNYFFPGGHIEEGESAPTALVREIMEEIGEKAEISGFLGATENKYSTKAGEVHEINLVFEVSLIDAGVCKSKENHLEFAWLTRDELRDAIIFPATLRDAVLATQSNEHPFWVSEGF